MGNSPASEYHPGAYSYSSPRSQTRLPTFQPSSFSATRSPSKLLSYTPKVGPDHQPTSLDYPRGDANGYIKPLRDAMESPIGYSIEAHIEKQNRVLNKVLGMVAKQKEAADQRDKYALAQKMKDLEYDKMKVDLELERQKSKTLSQSLIKLERSPPKKDKSNLEKVVMGLVMKKTAARMKSRVLDEDGSAGLPTIKEKEIDENQQRRPQISRRRRRIVSPGGTIFMEATPMGAKSIKSLTGDEDSYSGYFGGMSTNRSIGMSGSGLLKSRNNLKENTSRDFVLESGCDVDDVEDYGFEENLRKSSKRKGTLNHIREEEVVEKVEKFERQKRKRKTTRKEKTRREGVVIGRDVIESLKGVIPEPQDDRRKMALARIMGLGWTIVLPRLLYKMTRNKAMKQRKRFEESISGTIGQIYELSKMWIEDSAGKEIQAMLKDVKDVSNNFIFTNIHANLAKKAEKPCVALMAHFKLIFNKLYVCLDSFPSALLELLGPIVKEDTFMQHDYFSIFEIKRMKFGPFGSLREMGPQRVKLILGGIILMRVLIYSFIMRPWEAFKQDKTKFKIDKLLNIGSILYNTVMGIFKLSVPAYDNNQSFLAVEHVTNPKKNVLQAVDNLVPEKGFVPVEKDLTRDSEIISGFYAGHQLSAFFVSHKKIAEELKPLIGGWLDALYEKVSKVNN